MKKTIIIWTIVLMLVLSIVVDSPPVPAPIRGYFYINDHSVAGYTIEAENLRTGEVISGADHIEMITQSGGFAFDLSFFTQGYAPEIPDFYPGDPIEVRVGGIDVKETFNAPDTFPYSITLRLSVDSIVESTLLVQCWDGSYVKEAGLCPAVTTTTISTTTTTVPKVTYVCADGLEVDDKSDCPESDEGFLGWIISIIAAVFAAAGGFKFYKGRYMHYHRGLSSYHDPSTRHRNLKYRHRLWKDGAWNCINDVTKIQKGIDLTQ